MDQLQRSRRRRPSKCSVVAVEHHCWQEDMLPDLRTVTEELATFLAAFVSKDADVFLWNIRGIGAPAALDELLAINVVSDLAGSDALNHVFGISDLGRCASLRESVSTSGRWLGMTAIGESGSFRNRGLSRSTYAAYNWSDSVERSTFEITYQRELRSGSVNCSSDSITSWHRRGTWAELSESHLLLRVLDISIQCQCLDVVGDTSLRREASSSQATFGQSQEEQARVACFPRRSCLVERWHAMRVSYKRSVASSIVLKLNQGGMGLQVEHDAEHDHVANDKTSFSNAAKGLSELCGLDRMGSIQGNGGLHARTRRFVIRNVPLEGLGQTSELIEAVLVASLVRDLDEMSKLSADIDVWADETSSWQHKPSMLLCDLAGLGLLLLLALEAVILSIVGRGRNGLERQGQQLLRLETVKQVSARCVDLGCEFDEERLCRVGREPAAAVPGGVPWSTAHYLVRHRRGDPWRCPRYRTIWVVVQRPRHNITSFRSHVLDNLLRRWFLAPMCRDLKAAPARFLIPGRSSSAIFLHIRGFFFVSDTRSYPPSAITRLYNFNRSMCCVSTFGSFSMVVLRIALGPLSFLAANSLRKSSYSSVFSIEDSRSTRWPTFFGGMMPECPDFGDVVYFVDIPAKVQLVGDVRWCTPELGATMDALLRDASSCTFLAPTCALSLIGFLHTLHADLAPSSVIALTQQNIISMLGDLLTKMVRYELLRRGSKMLSFLNRVCIFVLSCSRRVSDTLLGLIEFTCKKWKLLAYLRRCPPIDRAHSHLSSSLEQKIPCYRFLLIYTPLSLYPAHEHLTEFTHQQSLLPGKIRIALKLCVRHSNMASQDGLFGRALLCHSILKFSHSTLPRSASPSGWNHIQAPDLFALVEQLDHACIQLRIVHGTNDLVGCLPTKKKLSVEYLQEHKEVLPLTAIIQETKELHQGQPNQITRYQHHGSLFQVRRIQLRFPDEASCNEAVQLLSGHGLMFSVPNTKQNTQIQARPMTANSYLSRQPSVQSARFDHATSSIIVPTIQARCFPVNFEHSETVESAHPRSGQPAHVHFDELSRMHVFTPSPGPKEYETRNIQRQQTFAPIRTGEEPAERPSTAPIEWPSDMMRKMLPPRRELPFPKPSSSPAKTKTLPPLPKPRYAPEAIKPDKSVEQESQSRASLENKIQPGITRLATPRGPTRFEPPASRMYNFNPKPDPMVIDNDSPGFSDTSTLTHETNVDVIPDSDQRYRRSASPVHFASSSTGGKLLTSPERSFSLSSEQMTSSSPSERRSQRLAQKHVQQDAEMQDMEMTTDSAQQSAQDALRQYAEQPREIRAEAITQFILASLEDDAFLKLCVDVDACWQRQVLDRRHYMFYDACIHTDVSLINEIMLPHFETNIP
ncbi:hypothetical protein KCU59_g1, partial [Aureobasidium melanogenum]